VITRRAVLGAALTIVLFALPPTSEGQPARSAERVYRIGFLIPISVPDPASAQPPIRRNPAFTERMKELGWIEGRTFKMELRFSDRDEGKLRSVALELARLPVDVIVAVSSPAVQAARAATDTIPIVAIDLETDPVAKGFATSLARPGKNITGLFLDLPELNGKRLELLRELIPRLRRVAVLWEPGLDPAPLKAAEAAARTASVVLHVVSASRRADFEQALRAAAQQQSGAVMVIQSPLFDVYAKDIADLAVQHRLPSIAVFKRFAEAGGLMSYGPDLEALFAKAANYVDRISKGAQAGDLPIERPARFELVINLKTAKALGLTIPPSLLLRAGQVIE
jgi:putative tryptophan/tyrosine transport system substrate-binding protein